jgi:hypothetical protein
MNLTKGMFCYDNQYHSMAIVDDIKRLDLFTQEVNLKFLDNSGCGRKVKVKSLDLDDKFFKEKLFVCQFKPKDIVTNYFYGGNFEVIEIISYDCNCNRFLIECKEDGKESVMFTEKELTFVKTVVKETAKKCNCPLKLIMAKGCQCGGV